MADPKTILHVIKIGGNIIDDEPSLDQFTKDIAALTEPFILVHGGGKLATGMSQQLGIATQLVDGRRITDERTLDVVVMIYAGLINKTIVAKLQANGTDAIGLCGADANIIASALRSHPTIDYGKVGDIKRINAARISALLDLKLTPVIAPITHDEAGNLLNTNADTVASALAVALAHRYEVHLHYCFEKNGVLRDLHDEQSVIPVMDQQTYLQLKTDGTIHSGMIPKLDNAFKALADGVARVHLVHALQLTSLFSHQHGGTTLIIS